MLTFEYTAKDPNTGKEIKAEVQADSERSAAKLISDQGLAPLEINVKGDSKSIFKRKKRIGSKDKVLFSRQMSTLINAGLPLTQSLRTVAEQTEAKELVVVINAVLSDVEGGAALADSLARHPKVFNEVYVNLVAAGESSGTLDEALERIANQQEKDAEIASKVKGALLYPVIVLVVIVGVIIFMLTTVLPQVEQLYVDLNQSLPFITSAMLFVSRLLITFWYVGIIAAIGFGMYVSKYIQTENGRKTFDHIKMRAPIFGSLFMKVYMARFSRTGQTLLSSGVPMLEMMRITGNAVNNVHINGSLQKASEKVKGGKALSESIEGDENFLRLVPQMINIGEQSGAMDDMMGKIADYYEKEVDNEIKAISTTIEPVLMVVLAVVAGAMVGAILIPVYGLVGQSIAI